MGGRGVAMLLLALLPVLCGALDNGLGRTPQMGWNSWNKFACAGLNEAVVRQTADLFVSTGLAAAGYQFINLDDCWQSSRDSKTQEIIPDPKSFPSGIPALANYIHSKGLKFGLYTDLGTKTCAGRPGSLGFEKIDAATYAKWQIDYVKVDNCYSSTPPEERYPVMRDALNATGRPIFYSMCEWGVDDPAKWAMPVGNSWRVSGDINDSWGSMVTCSEASDRVWRYSGPGGWNDPDMLEIGNGGMTLSEYRVHMFLWAIQKAPLLIGCDVSKMSDDIKNILIAPEVVAVNQDALGVQGHLVRATMTPSQADQPKVRIAPCENPPSAAQRWVINSTDHSIRLRAPVGGNVKCLDVYDCQSKDGAVVQIFDCHASDPTRECQSKNQQWDVNDSGTITTRVDSRCLDVWDFVGPVVETWSCNGGDNQKWQYDATVGTLKSEGQCLTVEQTGDLQVWAGPLKGLGVTAGVLVNKASDAPYSITATTDDLFPGQPCPATGCRFTVRDIFGRRDLGTFTGSFTTLVPPHDALMIRAVLVQ